MKNKKMRKIAILVAVMMLVMSFSSTGFASWLDQTIKASYRNISVFVNGAYKQTRDANGNTVEPFIVNGTTYVPLRGISEILGFQVEFNPVTYRIDITGTDTYSLQAKIVQQEATIKSLQLKLEEYTSYNIKDLEEDLLEEFEDLYYTRNDYVSFEISLSGDTEEIFIEFDIDEEDFGILTEDEIKDYLIDIYKFIQDQDNFEGTLVEGEIVDGRTDLAVFSFSSRGRLTFELEI